MSVLPLALTQGDPSGIGPELALKAWLKRTPSTRPFFILADPGHLGDLAKALGLNVAIAAAQPETAAEIFNDRLPVLPLSMRPLGRSGRPSMEDASTTVESIARAVSLIRAGRAAAVVTNPIAKEVLYKVGFHYPGHTEYLGAEAGRLWGEPCRAVMMLWSPELAVTPATIHIPLARVAESLSRELIVTTGRIVARDLQRRFGIAQPRLAVSGLNPHAGEGGAIGAEERDIIAPAIAELVAEGIAATGPHSADTLFHAKARQRYDVAITMYHDQALIPIKTIAFEHGVNVTLGLPFVRTSPDHGTAFDIAGRGVADPTSLIAALELAARLA